MLGKIKGLEAFPEIESTAAEQLLVYFINRHLPDAPEEGFRAERIAFAALALRMISAAAEFKGLFEGARLFSSEIEYSDENVSALLGLIHDENEVSF